MDVGLLNGFSDNKMNELLFGVGKVVVIMRCEIPMYNVNSFYFLSLAYAAVSEVHLGKTYLFFKRWLKLLVIQLAKKSSRDDLWSYTSLCFSCLKPSHC